MSTGSVYQPHSMPSSPQSWGEVWRSATTRPSVATFENIVSHPGVSARRAYIWIFVSALVGYSLIFLSLILSHFALIVSKFAGIGTGNISELARKLAEIVLALITLLVGDSCNCLQLL